MPPVIKTEVEERQHLLGDVLVAGGCGFFGYTLIRQLLSDPDCGHITVLDRVAPSIENRHDHDGVTYVVGSIADADCVQDIVQKVKPRAIFHAAVPNVTFPEKGRWGWEADMHETNVHGTKVLLNAAKGAGVRAVVYRSSIDAFANPPHDNIDETHPLWELSSRGGDAYGRTKAEAARMVLAANDRNLKTAVMHHSHMYGVRESQMLRVMLDTFGASAPRPKKMQPLYQLGPGDNLIEELSVDNAALAHRLAAKALLSPSSNAAGEAFIISDNNPVKFWHLVRTMWTAAAVYRGELAEGEEGPAPKVIPGWVMLSVAFVVTWTLRVFTLGFVPLPRMFRPAAISYSLYSHTYDSRKARERLRFEPEAGHDAIVKEAVEWELRRREKKARDGKKGR